MKYRSILFSLAILILVTGCGSDKFPLSGKVTYSDDGSPVPMGTVFFETPQLYASGKIQEDGTGTYVVETKNPKDGIPKGTYRVYVLAEEVTFTQVKNPPPGVLFPEMAQIENHTPLIDPKYSNPETSGLTFTVDGKVKTFDIKVERPRK